MTRYRYKIVAVIWLGIVTILSLIPTPQNTKMVSDKLVHYLFYLVTTAVVYKAFGSEGSKGYMRRLLASSAGVFTYSVSMEFIQMFLPYRSFSIKDIGANAAGIATFMLLLYLYRLPLRQRHK